MWNWAIFLSHSTFSVGVNYPLHARAFKLSSDNDNLMIIRSTNMQTLSPVPPLSHKNNWQNFAHSSAAEDFNQAKLCHLIAVTKKKWLNANKRAQFDCFHCWCRKMCNGWWEAYAEPWLNEWKFSPGVMNASLLKRIAFTHTERKSASRIKQGNKECVISSFKIKLFIFFVTFKAFLIFFNAFSFKINRMS